jgi:hypothetical protein
MPQFFFPVDYDGSRYDDERGESFATAQEAADHARAVTAELSRNNSKSVVVHVVVPDGSRASDGEDGPKPIAAPAERRQQLADEA